MGVLHDADVSARGDLRQPLIAEQREILKHVVTEACVELLAAYSMPVGEVIEGDGPPRPSSIFGIIGFSGQVQGSLTVVASSELFGSTFPTMNGGRGTPSRPELLDWAGEIANQTLGRIKRLFCRRGLDFDASTPKVGDVGDLRALVGAEPLQGSTVGLVLTVSSGLMSVGFAVVPPVGGALFEDEADAIPCAPEGDILLF